ncbi:MAG TPA: hypothetical protein VH165_16070 [Kofleriaceae bacterium]|nr:hypothetical protein [Kofleriaceae bacterium]
MAFRDGVEASWQLATMKTPSSFEAVVHGPYIVATVCNDGSEIFETRELAGTPDDSHDLDPLCGSPPEPDSVTGHMAQPGSISFGAAGDENFGDSGWDFQLAVADGTYDLLALTADGIEARRNITVNADLAVTPEVDVAKHGTPLTAVAFTAGNAMAGEQLAASVLLNTTATFSADLYEGPAATAVVAPESVLVADDNQTVSVQATVTSTVPVTAASATAQTPMQAPMQTVIHEVGRSQRQSFRVGGNATYTLPPPIGPIQWSMSSGPLVVTWTDRPATSAVFATSLGLSVDGAHSAANTLELSEKFLAATAITHVMYSVDLPGYKPEWKIDFTKRYSREIDFQSSTDGLVGSSNWDSQRLVPGTAAAGVTPMPAARLTPGLRR